MRYTVLVVDDEPRNLQLVASILSPAYRIMLADDPAEALKVCFAKQPDLILLDIVMKTMSGYELAQQLKSDKRTQTIPIVFLTVKASEDDIDKAFQVGAVDYISKPFKAKELLARVKTQITLQVAEKRLRQVINLVPHRLFARDSAGRIVLANEAAAAFYAKNIDELLNTREPALPEGYQYVVIDNGQCPPEEPIHRMYTCEEQLIQPEGKKQYFQTSKIPFCFSESGLPAVLEIAIDITKEKEKQAKIRQLNQELLKHSQYKDKLLSVIAHDLITPLFNMDMSLGMLQSQIDTLPADKVRDKISKTKDNASATLKLLTNLLEWTKTQFEAVSYNPVALNLFDEVQKVLTFLQSQLYNKNINVELAISQEQQIMADTDMLQTILRNLIANAIKYSKEEGVVVVSTKERDSGICISIADDGVGMSAEHLQKIRQGNMEHITTYGTKGERGSGIGLNLAREFIQWHGGELEVESEEGKGSTFTFTIPTNHHS
ncbi:two-component system sensor histidine kinase [Fulvivirga imtechensis AK7]|uniref:histidine kinase n=2 Tax=Fulvivirga TaxID=396811 RepID=L8JLU3_9BACT|nr:two-component system sensor histidine kinase [Fulvivirga imtechensis AK7]